MNSQTVGEPIDLRFLNRLRVVGIIEGCSTLLLFFVAMPLKYIAGYPLAVTIAGSIHGAFFMLLVGMLGYGIERIPITRRIAFWGVIGAIIPFGPFVVDRHLKEIARLS